MTLRYTLDGKPSGLVSYAGDVALFTVLKRILFTPGLGVEVTVLDPVSVDGKTRQALCLEASALMSGALGVSDATAEREEARQAPPAGHVRNEGRSRKDRLRRTYLYLKGSAQQGQSS